MKQKISKYAYVYGPHDYNAAPFVPIGMETLVHDNPKRNGKFVEHFRKGFVLSTEFENYRSWIMWMKDTRVTRILATVFHKHKCITNLDITPEDQVIAATGKLAGALKGCMPPPFSGKPSSNWSALGPYSSMSGEKRFITICP